MTFLASLATLAYATVPAGAAPSNTAGDDPKVTCIVNGAPAVCTGGDDAATKGTCSSFKSCDLIERYINPFINFLAVLVGLVVVIAVIIGGIEYATSAGDPQKASAARARIRNAVIALIVFVLLYGGISFLIPGGVL